MNLSLPVSDEKLRSRMDAACVLQVEQGAPVSYTHLRRELGTDGFNRSGY